LPGDVDLSTDNLVIEEAFGVSLSDILQREQSEASIKTY